MKKKYSILVYNRRIIGLMRCPLCVMQQKKKKYSAIINYSFVYTEYVCRSLFTLVAFSAQRVGL